MNKIRLKQLKNARKRGQIIESYGSQYEFGIADKYKVQNYPNLANGYVFGDDDVIDTIAVTQTVIGATFAIKDPDDKDQAREKNVLNKGSASFTTHGEAVQPGKGVKYIWNVNQWIPTGASSIKPTKYTVVQNIVAGVNTITHNLGLTDTRGFVWKVLDQFNNTIIISNFSAYTANSFSFTSPTAETNAHFTIVTEGSVKANLTQTLATGSNTINHNLGLTDARGFVVQVVDTLNNTVIMSNFASFTANSFTINNGGATISLAHLTIL